MTAAGGRDMLRGAKASGGAAEKQAGRGGRVALVSFQAAEARGSSPPFLSESTEAQLCKHVGAGRQKHEQLM